MNPKYAVYDTRMLHIIHCSKRHRALFRAIRNKTLFFAFFFFLVFRTGINQFNRHHQNQNWRLCFVTVVNSLLSFDWSSIARGFVSHSRVAPVFVQRISLHRIDTETKRLDIRGFRLSGRSWTLASMRRYVIQKGLTRKIFSKFLMANCNTLHHLPQKCCWAQANNNKKKNNE